MLSVRDKKPSLNFEATAETAFKTGPKGIRKYATAAKYVFVVIYNFIIRLPNDLNNKTNVFYKNFIRYEMKKRIMSQKLTEDNMK